MVKGKAFQVPKALLCYNSQYFEAALDEELKEEMSDMAEDVKKRTIELDMATEEGFELVLQWSRCPDLSVQHYCDVADGC
jgi:hypothetical protein